MYILSGRSCDGFMFVRCRRRWTVIGPALGGVSRLLKFWVVFAIAVIFTLSESLPAMHFGIVNISVYLSVCLSKFIRICPSERYYGSVKHNDPASMVTVVKRYIVLFRAYSPFYMRQNGLYLYRYAMYFKITFDLIVVLILSISSR